MMSHTSTIPSGSRTITITSAQANEDNTPNNSNNQQITIKLRRKDKKKVNWKSDTVDNEHLNKKSSKCCCIYEKPRRFGESSSESEEDDCDHCRGHVDKKKNSHSSSLASKQTSESVTTT